jgi:hypothetical protein
MDFLGETCKNAKAIYLNAPFWAQRSFTSEGVPDELKWRVLTAIIQLWNDRRPGIRFSIRRDAIVQVE